MATHQISVFEQGWVDIRKAITKNADPDPHSPTGSFQGANAQVFIANAGGTTTTVVGAAANLATSLNCIRLGERFMLFDSNGRAKEATVFTTTAHNGTTTVTFTPAAAVATASGDTCRLVESDALDGNNGMDAFLMSVAGGSMTQATVDKLTANDKLYAFRHATDIVGLRGY